MDGINYHFVDEPTFAGMVKKNAFLEYAEVFGNHYGTSQEWVQLALEEGVDVILEIDWQGAEQVRQHFSKSISIFILPPSTQALEDRLNDRGQDNADVIQHRIAAAKEEMSHYADADYLVVNDDFELARHQLEAIIIAQRCHLDIMSAEPILSDLLS
jgi:guanylate kinase